jgi:hypothetical protein
MLGFKTPQFYECQVANIEVTRYIIGLFKTAEIVILTQYTCTELIMVLPIMYLVVSKIISFQLWFCQSYI